MGDHRYTQFHSLAYTVKLNIELCMAELISKIVRRRDRIGGPSFSSSFHQSFAFPGPESRRSTRRSTSGALPVVEEEEETRDEPVIKEDKRGGGEKVTEGSERSQTGHKKGTKEAVPRMKILKTVAIETIVRDRDEERDIVEVDPLMVGSAERRLGIVI
jgi:hypothetical protein